MGFLSKLFGSGKRSSKLPGHAVIVHFFYGSTNFQYVYALEDQLRSAISNSGAGEYERHEVAKDGSDGAYYMSCPDAEELFRVISPLLEAFSFTRGATVTLRYGPKKRGTPKRVFTLPD
jgi:hypothetical protein